LILVVFDYRFNVDDTWVTIYCNVVFTQSQLINMHVYNGNRVSTANNIVLLVVMDNST